MIGSGYEIDFLIILFLCGSSVYFEKKGILPVMLYIVCFIYTAAFNVFNLLGWSSYVQLAVKAGLFFIALICDRTYKQNILSPFKRQI